MAPRGDPHRADPVGGELDRHRLGRPRGAAVRALEHRAGAADDPAVLPAHEHVVEALLPDGRRLHLPAGAAVLGVEDDGVDADGPAAAGVDEMDAEERALDRRVLLVEGAATVVARP